jgi:hypothetical protein
VRLADGDLVRLAADVTGEVLLPRQEADPGSLSREPANGHDAVTGHSDSVNGHHEPR